MSEQMKRERLDAVLEEYMVSVPEPSHSTLVEWIQRYPEFAEELLETPEPLMEAAHAALLDLDLPMDVYLERAHVRIIELPRHFKTRELRSDHIGKLLAIDGLVRTATEVRPKIVSAAFQCQRCGFTLASKVNSTQPLRLARTVAVAPARMSRAT